MFMGGNDTDRYYGSICDGITPANITTKRVLIDSKETGIGHPDLIMGEVAKLAVENDIGVTEEILKRVTTCRQKDRRIRDQAACCI